MIPVAIEIPSLAVCATPSAGSGVIEWSNDFRYFAFTLGDASQVACGVGRRMVRANGVPIRMITMFGANRVIPRRAAERVTYLKITRVH